MQHTLQENNPDKKLSELKKLIASRGSMLISFSGGVDSSLLAVIARELLGTRSRCVFLDSPVVPRSALRDARKIARDHDLEMEVLPVAVMDDERFVRNPAERCYICKKRLISVLKKRQRELGCSVIADGCNVSDTGEHRPGITAANEEGIVHPFIEAGITKADIRSIARSRGYPFWNKPSAACLSSRIPYGEPITAKRLAMIELAEDWLSTKGFIRFRVRIGGATARIEVPEEDIPRILTIRHELVKKFREIGFVYTTLDLEGYRSGSMDEILGRELPDPGISGDTA